MALIVAVLAVVAILDVATAITLGHDADPADLPGLLLTSSVVWLSIILGASAYKGLLLRGGGGVVARAMGGTRVDRGALDPNQQRLLNVVEEMSIASGIAMPEVYVLEDETAINAFAAGHTPANAAVAVTRGAIEQLSREELQGVIAHEFSHILNGDMRLNIRLMGWLFGLMVIALLGRLILRVGGRSSRGKGGGGLFVLAIAMLVLGWAGAFCGRVIQAAISRHRERLADASAVQFTRNPLGLKGALLKIFTTPGRARLETARTEEVAHMLFAAGSGRWLATHPPIQERLKALDPSFDERSLKLAPQDGVAANSGAADNGGATVTRGASANAIQSGAIVGLAPATIAAQVGEPTAAHVARAMAVRAAIPKALQDFALPERAPWLLLALVLSNDPAVRSAQQRRIATQFGPAAEDEMATAMAATQHLLSVLRLPVALRTFPSLRRLPRAKREMLQRVLSELIQADARVDVFEFCLSRLLAASLRDELEAREPHGRLTIADCVNELGVVFAILASQGISNDAQARRAYEAGLATLLPRVQPDFAVPSDWPQRMDAALERLENLQPLAKRSLIEAMVRTVSHDSVLDVAEAELLRTVCARLNCPLPPILPALQPELRYSD